jgi:hypothetical protein
MECEDRVKKSSSYVFNVGDDQLGDTEGVLPAGENVLHLTTGTANVSAEPVALKQYAGIGVNHGVPHLVYTNPAEKDPSATQAIFFYHPCLHSLTTPHGVHTKAALLI